jgi:hypothetical protein
MSMLENLKIAKPVNQIADFEKANDVTFQADDHYKQTIVTLVESYVQKLIN